MKIESRGVKQIKLVEENNSVDLSDVDMSQSSFSLAFVDSYSLTEFKLNKKSLEENQSWSERILLTRSIVENLNKKKEINSRSIMIEQKSIIPQKNEKNEYKNENNNFSTNLSISFSVEKSSPTVNISISSPIIISNQTNIDIVLSKHTSTINEKQSVLLYSEQQLCIDWLDENCCIKEFSLGLLNDGMISWSKRVDFGVPLKTTSYLTLSITDKKEKIYNCFVLEAIPPNKNNSIEIIIRNKFLVFNSTSKTLYLKQSGTKEVHKLKKIDENKNRKAFIISNWRIDKSTSIKVSALNNREREELEEKIENFSLSNKISNKKEEEQNDFENDLREDYDSVWSQGIMFDLNVHSDNILLRYSNGIHQIISYSITEVDSIVNLVFYDCERSPFIFINKCRDPIYYSKVDQNYCRKMLGNSRADFNWKGPFLFFFFYFYIF